MLCDNARWKLHDHVDDTYTHIRKSSGVGGALRAIRTLELGKEKIGGTLHFHWFAFVARS